MDYGSHNGDKDCYCQNENDFNPIALMEIMAMMAKPQLWQILAIKAN